VEGTPSEGRGGRIGVVVIDAIYEHELVLTACYPAAPTTR
jgi:hypothetical protein